ncbi:hypothetical protein DERP_005030 [Dermatophagoides pteronyssinus]|uniref:Uncharacterized protein n=1 Tax=Dermatophagoides pteronyssinus TaxID=6956 RepID=A0ABQ8JT97_DERPT|nr:hypothetical protein DERP_005030 [Dermatophagoides pteronyssinus]
MKRIFYMELCLQMYHDVELEVNCFADQTLIEKKRADFRIYAPNMMDIGHQSSNIKKRKEPITTTRFLIHFADANAYDEK